MGWNIDCYRFIFKFLFTFHKHLEDKYEYLRSIRLPMYNNNNLRISRRATEIMPAYFMGFFLSQLQCGKLDFVVLSCAVNVVLAARAFDFGLNNT